MDYNRKSPLEMDQFELREVIQTLFRLGGRPAVISYLEQWDAIELLDKLKLEIKADIVGKARWKSTKTKFVKIYTKELSRLRSEGLIDYTLLGIATELTTFTNYEDNVLRNDKGKPLGQKEIAKEIGMPESTLKRHFKKLFDIGIIMKKQNPKNKSKNIYYLNPELFYMGVLIDSDLKQMIKEYHNNKIEELKVEQS